VEFDPKNEKFDKIIKISTLVLLVLNIFFIALTSAKRSFPDRSPYLSKSAHAKDICYFGIKSILDREPSESYFTEKIFDLLKDEPLLPLDFEGDEVISSLITLSKTQCKLITKDKRGLRSFDVTLHESSSSAFGAQIKNIEEQELEL
jgi:hypothetical protein